MGEDQGQVGTTVDKEQPSPEQIRREIEDTRQELGHTAAALAAKTDVKARAKEKVEGVKETFGSSTSGETQVKVKAKARENPVPTAAIAAFIGGFLFGRLTSR